MAITKGSGNHYLMSTVSSGRFAPGGPFTVMLHVNPSPSGTNFQGLCGSFITPGGDGWALGLMGSDNTTYFGWKNGSYSAYNAHGGTLADSVWTHLCARYYHQASPTYDILINGVVTDSIDDWVVQMGLETTAAITIGTDIDNAAAPAGIAEFRLFSRILSDAEVRRCMESATVPLDLQPYLLVGADLTHEPHLGYGLKPTGFTKTGTVSLRNGPDRSITYRPPLWLPAWTGGAAATGGVAEEQRTATPITIAVQTQEQRTASPVTIAVQETLTRTASGVTISIGEEVIPRQTYIDTNLTSASSGMTAGVIRGVFVLVVYSLTNDFGPGFIHLSLRQAPTTTFGDAIELAHVLALEPGVFMTKLENNDRPYKFSRIDVTGEVECYGYWYDLDGSDEPEE